MRLHTDQKWLKAALQPAPAICAFMALLVWAVLALVLQAERRWALESALQQGSNLARLLEKTTVSLLKDADRSLLLLRRAYEQDPSHFEFESSARQLVSQNPVTTGFAISDQYGNTTVLNSAANSVFTVYIGDRDYFLQQQQANTDTLLISRPVLGRRSHELSLPLSRRLTNIDGSFAGIVGAVVSPAFLGRFYNTIDIGQGGSVVLDLLPDLPSFIRRVCSSFAPRWGVLRTRLV
jgi:hypothetical protein